jgi:hypothetical protein
MSGRVKPRAARAPERPDGSGSPATLAAEAPFAAIGAEPIDAPMWPIHPGAWFQPERAPSFPAWSGLGVERHNRIPAPDFWRDDILPLNCVDTCDIPAKELAPNPQPVLPDSGLTALGWDPRTVYRKEKGE